MMKRFLEENGFVKIPKRGKHVKAIYCCQKSEIFVTFFKNGEWNVSAPGNQNLEDLETWRIKLSEVVKP